MESPKSLSTWMTFSSQEHQKRRTYNLNDLHRLESSGPHPKKFMVPSITYMYLVTELTPKQVSVCLCVNLWVASVCVCTKCVKYKYSALKCLLQLCKLRSAKNLTLVKANLKQMYIHYNVCRCDFILWPEMPKLVNK